MSLAFVFPGQGSQSLGMLAELAEAYPQVNATYEEASAVLGYDLWKLVQEGPEEELNKTHVTQPAMLAAGVAVWRVWEGMRGPKPMTLAGHSLGEYTALVCAGSLDFSAAIGLVADRGRFMQEAVPEGQGAMAALLGLDDGKVIDICETAARSGVVAAVNFNAPGQVVVAGEKKAVEKAVDLAKEAGAKRAVVLAVSVPSHCQLMKPAAERLKERLEAVEIRVPAIPVINNVDVKVVSDPAAIRDALVRQLYSPVRWADCMRRMAADGVSQVVEGGPGKVLVGLAKRIVRDVDTYPLFDQATLDKALEAVG